MKFYCIWVVTGLEEAYVKEMQEMLDSDQCGLKGKLYFLKKQMRLKKGTMYYDALFPGYVFIETDEIDFQNFFPLMRGKGFIRFLPQNNDIRALYEKDLGIIRTILKYGTTIPIVNVVFDVNDRIQLLDGPFKEISGTVTAVNRRNKRVNIEVELMNGIRLVGLTYQEVRKV